MPRPPRWSRSALCCRAWSVVEILHDVYRVFRIYPIPIHVVAGCAVDELAQIVHSQSQAGVAGIVDKDEQLEPQLLAPARDPLRHREGRSFAAGPSHPLW